MPSAIAPKKALENYRRYLKEVRKPGLDSLKDCSRNNSVRRAAADKFRDKFIQESIEKLGINFDKVEALRKRDEQSARDFLVKQRQKVLEYGKDRAGRIQRLREKLPERGAVLNRLKNPPYRRHLKYATNIEADVTSVGNVSLSDFVILTDYEYNSARLLTTINNNGTAQTYVDFYFIWIAESDGIMTAETNLYFNGSFERFQPGNCKRCDSRAQFVLWSEFAVSQSDLSGEPRAIAPGSTEPLFSFSHLHDHSSSESEVTPILPDRDFVSLSSRRMEIVEGLPVLFNVTIGYFLSCNENADVAFDFHTPPYDINVHLISLQVDT